MSHSFKSYSAKPSFAQFKESTNSSDYITQKKIQNLKNQQMQVTILFKKIYNIHCIIAMK